MAEVVITGGQGFIGRNLTNHLVALGEDVCSTYNYTLPNRTSKSNLSFHRVDVTRFEECLKLINQENPKVLFHLVAQPIVTSAIRHPFSTEELTIRGSYNMLEAVRQSDSDTKIIYISSDKVYGSNDNAKETDPLLGVDHPYNASKICGDIMAQMYAKYYKMNITIVRSANIYGGGDFHWDRLVPGMCRSIIHGNELIIRSDGKMLRDYIYVEDLMDAYVSIMDAMRLDKISGCTPINLGSTPYTPLEVLNTLLACAKCVDVKPTVLGQAQDEIDKQHINYELATKLLGWTPKTSLEDGLDKTFAWYKDWFSK